MNAAEKIVERTEILIREIADPVEFRRQIEEIFASEMPESRSTFEVGETMAMHEFLARYQTELCGGVLPRFYTLRLEVIAVHSGGIDIRIYDPE